MKFTSDGTKLVTGARKDHRLLVWDIRYYRRPLNILSRAVDTNQRVYFDISPCAKYLVTGGTDGLIRVISIHPSRPVIATGSGQLHLKDPLEDPEEPTIELSSSTLDEIEGDGPEHRDMKYSRQAENCL
ncbi:Uncharacterized protein OBRU01_04819, partial [Operophtera brumata]